MPKYYRFLMFYFISILAVFFVLLLHSKDNDKSQSNKDTVSISVEEFKKMKNQIQSLKRVQEALVKNERRLWKIHVQELIDNGETVFPRVDNYCPSTMIHVSNGEMKTGKTLVVNTCDIEKEYWNK